MSNQGPGNRRESPPETGAATSSESVQSRRSLTKPKLRTSGLFRLPASHTLLLHAAVACLLGITLLLIDEQSRIPFVLMAIALGGMVWLRSGWSLICFFMILFTLKFIEPMGWGHQFRQMTGALYPNDLVFVFVTMTFIGVSLRYFEINKYEVGFFSEFGWARLIKSIGLLGSTESMEASRIRNQLTSTKFDRKVRFPSLFGGRWWLLFGAILLAWILLRVFPEDQGSIKAYWIKPRPMRMIFMFGALFLVWFTTRGLFALVMRLKMDPDQAGVQVRSVYAKEFWREHRGIEARRDKMKRKQQN